MRRKEKEIRDIQLIQEIFKNGSLCHIAFSDNDEPYLITVNYGYRNRCLYFHSAREGRKMKIIRKNPRICFQVISDNELITGSDPCNDFSMKYKSVVGTGKAMLLKDSEMKRKGLKIIMEQYSDKGPFDFDEKNLNNTAVIKIEIDTITGKMSGY